MPASGSFKGSSIDLELCYGIKHPLDRVDTRTCAVAPGIGDALKEQGVQSSLSRLDPHFQNGNRVKNGNQGASLEAGCCGPAT